MKPKITLCMIVKNESHIIHECLNSIYKYIDYWIVSDTGSTDGTQDIIKNFFAEKEFLVRSIKMSGRTSVTIELRHFAIVMVSVIISG